uniref:AlNc14C327G10655 protein n=1 Tax=Albugo laibachii Nc14 TaxID=890382 RepID=F0WWP3_9STRA|nr:AlNc14C327G10655 [Albugo laibachii Nc14]|eukprot:CCA25868.1 AlNc14C327G10655 [Albugo laibachii Nc14]
MAHQQSPSTEHRMIRQIIPRIAIRHWTIRILRDPDLIGSFVGEEVWKVNSSLFYPFGQRLSWSGGTVLSMTSGLAPILALENWRPDRIVLKTINRMPA